VAAFAPSEDPSSCVNTDPVGTCNSINALSTETGAYGTTYPVTPPMPVTIVGSGFGYPGETLPYVAPNPAYLQIQDDGKSTGGTTAWSTNGTTGINGGQASNCQVYIANWSDASISLVINAPIKAYNLYLPTGDYLSPLSDFSPVDPLLPESERVQQCAGNPPCSHAASGDNFTLRHSGYCPRRSAPAGHA
jgi:hypothetical protein